MKKLTEKHCRTVAFDGADFDAEVVKILHEDRVFAINTLPAELELAIKNLFESGDDFFDHFHEFDGDTFPAKIEPNNVRGLFVPEKYSLLCNNGVRFFISVNKEGGINNERMPLCCDKPLMSEAAKTFTHYTDKVISRVLKSIALTHDLNADELERVVLGDSCVGLTRFYPITQKRVEQMYKNGVLAIHGDDVEQFPEHRDVNPLTILVYRGGGRGLMIEDKKSKTMVPLVIDSHQPSLLVFTGTILKELTNGQIRALKHSVTTSPAAQHIEAQLHPHHWRFTLAKFTYCHRDKIEPLNTSNGQPIKPPKPRKRSRQPATQNKFFMDHLSTEDDIRQKARVIELPLGVMKKYPAEVKYHELTVSQLGEDGVGVYKNF